MLTESKRSPGLRRFIPQPDRYAERYGNFTLTARDYKVLEVIHRYRYLEARHVRALIGGSGQQITRRLQGLFHNGHVGRYGRRPRMRIDLDPGAPLIAYGLDLQGARALQVHRAGTDDQRGGRQLVRWRKDYTRRTEWFLEHRLMISNFRCALELALRTTDGIELVHWDEGQDTWFRTSIPGERSRVVRVAPDAFFSLSQDGETRHFFLEMDRSTEEQSRLLRKFQAYWWYLQSPVYQRTHANHRRVNVLFMTTGRQRMINMMTTLREMPKPNRASHGGKGLFWFSVEADYHLEDPASILRPMWRMPANSRAFRLSIV